MLITWLYRRREALATAAAYAAGSAENLSDGAQQTSSPLPAGPQSQIWSENALLGLPGSAASVSQPLAAASAAPIPGAGTDASGSTLAIHDISLSPYDGPAAGTAAAPGAEAAERMFLARTGAASALRTIIKSGLPASDPAPDEIGSATAATSSDLAGAVPPPSPALEPSASVAAMTTPTSGTDPAVAANTVLASAAVSLAPPAGYSTSQLIFEDNFTAAALNTAKWNPWIGDDNYGRWGDRGALPSPYSAENAGSYQVQYDDPYSYGYGSNTTGAHLGGGNALLQEIATPSTYFSSLGYSWASSAISTYGKEYLPATGGYLQISAKMPDSRYGAWAGLWLLPTAGSDGAEFDLQESGMSSNTSTANEMLSTTWWGGGKVQYVVNTGEDLSAAYHTYGLEYRPGQSFKMYLDGTLMYTWTTNISTNAAYEVIVELEMAGPSATGWHTVVDPVNHPGPFELDVNDIQIYSLAAAPVPPPAPTGLTLAPSSESGVAGSNVTDVTTPTITGQGQAGDALTLFDGSTQVGTASVQSNGSWSVTTTTLSNGVNTLTATETSASGTSAASAPLALTIDTTPPPVTVQLADDTGGNNITSNPALTGGGNASAAVTIKNGSTVLGTTTANGAGSWTFTPTLGNGTYTLSATETDLAGNTGTASLSFTLDTTPPPVTVQLADDTGGNNITSNPTLTGSGDPNAVVTIMNGNTVLGTTTANGTGSWTFKPTLGNGTYTLSASETNLAGGIGSASLTFTLDTTPPPVTEMLANDTGSSSTDNVTSNPTLTGGGAPNAVVTIMNGSSVLGTTTANSSGSWTFTPTLANGTYTLTASETDLVGNTGSASLTFSLDTTPPSLVYDSSLLLRAGHTATITSSLLQFSDDLSTPAQETYTIINGPLDGKLLLNGAPTNSFTQDDINNNRVTYQETTAGAGSDGFTFTVSDLAGNTTGPEQFQISIWSKHRTPKLAASTSTQFGFADLTGYPAVGGAAAAPAPAPAGHGASSYPVELWAALGVPLGGQALAR